MLPLRSFGRLTLGNVLLEECDISCGDLEVGLSEGCVTLVDAILSDESKTECLLAQVLGRRWRCAPSQGMERVVLGSCTLPP